MGMGMGMGMGRVAEYINSHEYSRILVVSLEVKLEIGLSFVERGIWPIDKSTMNELFL